MKKYFQLATYIFGFCVGIKWIIVNLITTMPFWQSVLYGILGIFLMGWSIGMINRLTIVR